MFNTWDQHGTQHEQIRGDDVASDSMASLISKRMAAATPKLRASESISSTPKKADPAALVPLAPIPRYQTSAYKNDPNKSKGGNWAEKGVSIYFHFVLVMGKS
jgi:hypothetical protein